MVLVIDNSYSRLEGLTPGQFADLRQLLSYVPDQHRSFHAGRAYNTRKHLLDKKCQFPTGLIYLVRKYAQDKGYKLLIRDDRKPVKPRPGLFNLTLRVSPYDAQKNAVAACITRNGVVTMPTGTGKSVTMALLVHALQLKTLVVVPNLALKQQLQSSFDAWFGGPNPNLRVENIDSSALDTLTDFDCLILDEAHHAGAATYHKLNRKAWKGIRRRFFFTATPFRSRDEEQILFEAICGQVIYRLSYRDAVKQGFIVPAEFYYFSLPKTDMVGADNNWQAVYSDLIVNNTYRNKVLADVIRNIGGQSTLCLVKEIKHGEELSRLTGAAFANGKAENTRELILEFALGERKTLIATTGVAGEGCDTVACEWVILAGGGKSKNLLVQMIGRGVRRFPGKDSCKVILFKDSSSKYLLQHFRECVKIIKEEYGAEVVALPLPTEVLDPNGA